MGTRRNRWAASPDHASLPQASIPHTRVLRTQQNLQAAGGPAEPLPCPASLDGLASAVDRHVRGRVAILLALLLAALCALAVLGDRAPAQDPTEELQGVQAKQGGLEAQIERYNAEVNDLIAQEAQVRDREAAVTEELSATQARLDEKIAEIDRERAHLAEVRERLQRAKRVLARTLVGVYKAGAPPDALSIILESASWSDVIAEADYLDRIENQHEIVIARVDSLAEQVEDTVEALEAAREQIEDDRDAIAAQRDQLASARSELEGRHADLLAAREARRGALQQLQSRESKLQKQIQTAPAPEAAPNVAAPGGQTASLVNGQAVAPANAPPAVQSAIEAANRIVGRPYVWGGGHGSFESSGYDCSGSVSYALHGGGFLSSPLDSTGLMTWGSPGAGSWITVYASSGHAYVVIAGLRLDTSGTVGGSGPSWSTEMRSSAGFVARHPDGY
jgi:peptidoglycan hydrolase CwlO-like protein